MRLRGFEKNFLWKMSPKDFTWFNMATLCQKSTLGGADSSILKTPKVSSNLPCSLWGAQPYLGRTLSGQSEIVRCVAAAYAQDKPPMLPWYVVWRSIMDSWTNVSRTECSGSMLVVESFYMFTMLAYSGGCQIPSGLAIQKELSVFGGEMCSLDPGPQDVIKYTV